MLVRVALIALVLVAIPAAAQAFPSEGEPWHLEVRAPGPPGTQRFARVVAEPEAGSGWSVTVTCGTVRARTGKEAVDLRARGHAAIGRGGQLGGTWTPVGGGTTGGFSVDRPDDRLLDVPVTMAAPCPSGGGDLSTGD